MRYRTGQCNLGNHPLCAWSTCTCTCHQPAQPTGERPGDPSRGEAAYPAVAEAPGGAERMLGAMLGPVPGALPPRAATAALDDPVDTVEAHTLDGGVIRWSVPEVLEADDTVPVERLAGWLSGWFGSHGPWRWMTEAQREYWRTTARTLRADLPELFR